MRFTAIATFILSSTAALAETPENSVISILHGVQSGESKSFIGGSGEGITFGIVAPSLVEMKINADGNEAMTHYEYKPIGGCQFQMTFSVAKPGDGFRDVFKATLDFSTAKTISASPTKITGMNKVAVSGLGFECAPSENGSCPDAWQLTFFNIGNVTNLQQTLSDFTARSCAAQ